MARSLSGSECVTGSFRTAHSLSLCQSAAAAGAPLGTRDRARDSTAAVNKDNELDHEGVCDSSPLTSAGRDHITSHSHTHTVYTPLTTDNQRPTITGRPTAAWACPNVICTQYKHPHTALHCSAILELGNSPFEYCHQNTHCGTLRCTVYKKKTNK